jgi:NADP-dependent 3-hydroxy acid dehydrogenase YdfG
LKTALVTGVTLGVGNLLVKALSENGYNVIATSRQPDKITNLNLPNVTLELLDVEYVESIDNFYNKYKDIALDLIVNNAAGACSPSELKNETPHTFNTSYNLNVSGPMYLTRLFIENLKRSDNPTIVFISSFAGRYPYVGGGNYCNAKRGVIGLSELFRLELAPIGIKVTEICPASINTRETEQKPTAIDADDVVSAIMWVKDLPRKCNVNILEIAPTYSQKP